MTCDRQTQRGIASTLLTSHRVGENSVCNCVCMRVRHVLKIIPVREGSLQLTATDLCLPALLSATATVIISDIGSIVVDVVDKVQQNNEISADVRVLDYGERPILRDHFTLMDLRLIAGSDIISVR